jgi:hypothetical protein
MYIYIYTYRVCLCVCSFPFTRLQFHLSTIWIILNWAYPTSKTGTIGECFGTVLTSFYISHDQGEPTAEGRLADSRKSDMQILWNNHAGPWAPHFRLGSHVGTKQLSDVRTGKEIEFWILCTSEWLRDPFPGNLNSKPLRQKYHHHSTIIFPTASPGHHGGCLVSQGRAGPQVAQQVATLWSTEEGSGVSQVAPKTPSSDGEFLESDSGCGVYALQHGYDRDDRVYNIHEMKCVWSFWGLCSLGFPWISIQPW